MTVVIIIKIERKGLISKHFLSDEHVFMAYICVGQRLR